MRNDLALVHVQHRLAESPYAAFVDRLAAAESRIEEIAIRHRVAFDAQQFAALARVSHLGRIETALASDALQPFAHSARTPLFAIGDTRATEATEPNAVCIAEATSRPTASLIQIATTVGPDPLIVHAKAPA